MPHNFYILLLKINFQFLIMKEYYEDKEKYFLISYE